MQADLLTYGKDLHLAQEQVLSGNPDTEWALMGYDRNTPSIKLISKGSGLESLSRSFSDGRIQYAFVRVIDQVSKLPKYVLICWCGEGVPEKGKGMMTSHLEDIKRRFQGFHIQLNARNEQDVTPEHIRTRVQGNIVTDRTESISHQQQHSPSQAKPSPIVSAPKTFGAALQPTSPVHTQTHRQTEEFTHKDVSTSSKLTNISSSNVNPVKSYVSSERYEKKTTLPLTKESLKPINPVLSEREKRMKELAELTGKNRSGEFNEGTKVSPSETFRSDPKKIVYQEKTISSLKDKRQIFENPAKISTTNVKKPTSFNSSLPSQQQQSFARSTAINQQPPSQGSVKETIRNLGFSNQQKSATATSTLFEKKNIRETPRELDKEEKDNLKLTKTKEPQMDDELPPSHLEVTQQMDAPEETAVQDDEKTQQWSTSTIIDQSEEDTLDNRWDTNINKVQEIDHLQDLGEQIIAIAIYDYNASDDNELSFKAGEKIHSIEKSHEGWWQGVSERGDTGFFPYNFVELQQFNQTTDNSTNTCTDENTPKAKALYDYTPVDESEIGFTEGDIITGVETTDDGWWRGFDCQGNFGMFPSNFVALV